MVNVGKPTPPTNIFCLLNHPCVYGVANERGASKDVDDQSCYVFKLSAALLWIQKGRHGRPSEVVNSQNPVKYEHL